MTPLCYCNRTGHAAAGLDESVHRVMLYMDTKVKQYKPQNSLISMTGIQPKVISSRHQGGIADNLEGVSPNQRLDFAPYQQPDGADQSGLHVRGTRQQILSMFADADIGIQFKFDRRLPVWVGAHNLGMSKKATLASMGSATVKRGIVAIVQNRNIRAGQSGIAAWCDYRCIDGSTRQPLDAMLHGGGELVTVHPRDLLQAVADALSGVQVY